MALNHPSQLRQVNKLIEALAAARTGAAVTNQYSFETPSNAIRRQNLRSYLEHFCGRPGLVLLVSEAPGYAGMRRTGVPFTSEDLLLRHPFFPADSYRVEAAGLRPRKEQSATIVWKAIDRCSAVPLLWPSFPFHPFKAPDRLSNRKPTVSELELGADFLRRIGDIFQPAAILPVGRVAESILRDVFPGDPRCSAYIRHPANGGAAAFTRSLIDFMQGHAGTH